MNRTSHRYYRKLQKAPYIHVNTFRKTIHNTMEHLNNAQYIIRHLIK